MQIGKLAKWMLLSWVILFSACNSTKEVVYLQDVVPLKQQDIERKYEVFIHEDDLLSIMVNSKDPELALPFNMPLVTYQIGSESAGQQRVLGYLVDTNGDIDFPILGKIHVVGLSRLELRELIKEKLISGDYIKDPDQFAHDFRKYLEKKEGGANQKLLNKIYEYLAYEKATNSDF